MPAPSHITEARKRIPVLLAVAAGLAVAAWSYLPAGDILERLELRTIDARFVARGPRPTSGEIAIIEVDDQSLAALGPWRWPRERFDALVQNLRRAGARAIAFDILFAEPDAAAGQSDAAFAETVRGAGRGFQAAATLPSARNVTPEQALSAAALQRFALTQPRIEPGQGLNIGAALHAAAYAVGPFPGLAEVSRGAGFVDVIASRDGVFRQYPPVVERQGKLFPSLALALAMDALGVRGDEVTVTKGRWLALGDQRRIPLDRAGASYINFAGPDHTFPYFSALDVTQHPDRIPQDALKGKLVFVAVTATGLYDLRASPYATVFNGVETQANALDSILTGRFLRRQRPEAALLVTLCGALIVGLFIARFRAGAFVALGLGLIAAYALLALWAFNARDVALAMVVPSLGMVLALAAVGAHQLVTQERQQRTLHDALSRFVPPEIASRLAQQDTAPVITGERRTVTVLFADLRGFTAASGRISPEDTVALLNRYFRLMHEVIFEFGGTLDKFMGDELMAFFNAPVEQIDHAHLAVATALEMQRRIEFCREEWAYFGMPELAAGIGISTGEVVVGYVGSGERMQYTVIGPDVNIASRLEDLAKELDARIVVSASTYELVRDMVKCRDRGSFALHGIPGETRAYQVVEMLDRTHDATGST